MEGKQLMKTKWIDVCRVDNEDVTLSPETFDKIISSYKPSEREVPLVLGHPKTDDPALGWVTKLRRAGETLQAQFKQVPDDLRELVNTGRYKKISIALFPDMTLRHIGLLGAAQPAVPGMRNVKFNKDKTYTEIEFLTQPDTSLAPVPGTKEENMDKDQKIKELEKKLADGRKKLEDTQTLIDKAKKDKEASDASLAAFQGEQRKKEIEAKIDGLIEKNNILPADKPAVSAIAMSLGKDSGEIELTAGSGKKAVVDHLFDFLAGLPDRKMLGEFSAPKDEKGDPIDMSDLAKHV